MTSTTSCSSCCGTCSLPDFFFFAGYYLIVFWVFFAVTSPYIFSWVFFVSDFPSMSDLLISQVPCSVVRWHCE